MSMLLGTSGYLVLFMDWALTHKRNYRNNFKQFVTDLVFFLTHYYNINLR